MYLIFEEFIDICWAVGLGAGVIGAIAVIARPLLLGCFYCRGMYFCLWRFWIRIRIKDFKGLLIKVASLSSL